MKKYISLFALAALFLSCNKDLVEKPDNLIDKKVMGDILYDLSILEALKYQDPNSLYKNGINPKTYIYKKYKIDSLQFAKSTQFYASDVNKYKTMYEEVGKKIETNKTHIDSLLAKGAKLKATPSPERANLDQPIVK